VYAPLNCIFVGIQEVLVVLVIIIGVRLNAVIYAAS